MTEVVVTFEQICEVIELLRETFRGIRFCHSFAACPGMAPCVFGMLIPDFVKIDKVGSVFFI